MTFKERVKALGPCSGALAWVESQSSPSVAWATCERADWMLWLLGRLSGDVSHSAARKKLVGCASECAATAIPFVKNPDAKAKLLEVASLLKGYSESQAGDTPANADVIRKARRLTADADAYAYAATAYAAAAYAADAAAAAYAATAYAAAAYAAYAAYAAAAAAARLRALSDMSSIVRRWYPKAPSLRGVK